MKVEIHIADDLYARYELQARAAGRSVKLEIADRLTRYVDAPAADRVLLVRRKARGELENTLQCSLQTDDDLSQRVTRLADLHIGEVHLDFTPAQLSELKRRADKNKRTFDEEFVLSVKSVQSLVFDRI